MKQLNKKKWFVRALSLTLCGVMLVTLLLGLAGCTPHPTPTSGTIATTAPPTGGNDTTKPPNPTSPTETNGTGTTKPTVPPVTEPTPTEPTIPPVTEPLPTEPTTPPATEPKPTEPEHQHSYTEEVTQAATCAAEGVKTFTCDCGEQYTEVIGKLPHDFSSVVTAPTCEERGFTTYACSCGHSFNDDFVDATGHDYGAWVTIQEPSEDADGTAQRVCQNCEKTETKVLEKLEHAHRYTSQVTKEASCTEEGVEIFSCPCGDSYTKPITKLPHSYTIEAIGPTCTEKGYTLHTCACGDSYRDSYQDAIGHSYGEWITTKEPTESETGTARRDCKNCESFETKTLGKLEHVHRYTSKVSKEPSCTAEGVETFTCSCGKSYTEAIAKLGHSYTAKVIKPTCTKKGYTLHTCACGDSYKDTYKNATGHIYGAWVTTKEPTETETGVARRDCKNCESFETKTLEKLEHVHRYTTKVTKEPSCTAEGIETFSCPCGDSYTIKIAKLDHSYTAKVIKPTCTEKGYTLHTCACGDSYKDTYKNATGHSYSSKVTKPSTCSEAGVKTYTCKCGDSYTKAIAKLDHEYSKQVTKPSCTKKGYTTYTCDCGNTYKDNYVDARGHSWSDWVVIVAPTDTTTGEAKRECTVCHATEKKVLDIGEHIHSYKETVVEPTCTVEGYTLHTCACGYSYKDAVVEATGHTTVRTVVERTCTQDGYTLRKCTKCDYRLVSNRKAAYGHSYGDWVTTQKPTATNSGLQKRNCTRCGDSQTMVVPATGNIPETYIDPRIEVKQETNKTTYYYSCDNDVTGIGVWDCTPGWDCYLSIAILDNNSFFITYFKQDGTKVEYTLRMPSKGELLLFSIGTTGEYSVSLWGGYV